MITTTATAEMVRHDSELDPISLVLALQDRDEAGELTWPEARAWAAALEAAEEVKEIGLLSAEYFEILDAAYRAIFPEYLATYLADQGAEVPAELLDRPRKRPVKSVKVEEPAEEQVEEQVEELAEAPAEETVIVRVPPRLVDVLADRDVLAAPEYRAVEVTFTGRQAVLSGPRSAMVELGGYVEGLAELNRYGSIPAAELFGLGASKLQTIARRFPR